jgi:hypothetical protein
MPKVQKLVETTLSSMYRVVLGELCCGQPFFPVILTKFDEYLKVLFNILIHSFCLTVSLGMIGSGGIFFGAENCEKFFDIFRHESGVSIMDDLTGESMIVYDSIS